MLENFFHQIMTDDDLFGALACFIFAIGTICLVWSMERESKKT